MSNDVKTWKLVLLGILFTPIVYATIKEFSIVLWIISQVNQ